MRPYLSVGQIAEVGTPGNGLFRDCRLVANAPESALQSIARKVPLPRTFGRSPPDTSSMGSPEPVTGPEDDWDYLVFERSRDKSPQVIEGFSGASVLSAISDEQSLYHRVD